MGFPTFYVATSKTLKVESERSVRRNGKLLRRTRRIFYMLFYLFLWINFLLEMMLCALMITNLVLLPALSTQRWLGDLPAYKFVVHFDALLPRPPVVPHHSRRLPAIWRRTSTRSLLPWVQGIHTEERERTGRCPFVLWSSKMHLSFCCIQRDDQSRSLPSYSTRPCKTQ